MDSLHPLPFAVTTGSFWPIGTHQSITLLHEMGIFGIELTLQTNEFRLGFNRFLQMPLYDELKLMVNTGLLFVHSIHAPHMDAEHGYSIRARQEYLWHTLETAHSLGAKIIVAHPFHLFISHEAAIAYLTREITSVCQALLPDIRSLLDQARAYDIIISLENVKIWNDDLKDFFNDPNNVHRLVIDLAHPAFGVTLDIVHAKLIGYLDTFLIQMAKNIVNLHLADIEMSSKRVPLGEGIIDWSKYLPILARLPNLRQVTVELTQATPDEVVRTYKALERLWVGRN